MTSQPERRPTCGACGKPMTPQNAKIHPEYFLHDAYLPPELLPPTPHPASQPPAAQGLNAPNAPGVWFHGDDIYIVERDSFARKVFHQSGIQIGYLTTVANLPRGNWYPASAPLPERELREIAENNYNKWQEWRIKCGDAENARQQISQHLAEARTSLTAAEARAEKLQAFKDWVHAYLDNHGVPHHPPGTHGAAGCRIGDRMDWLMERLSKCKGALRACHGLLVTITSSGVPKKAGDRFIYQPQIFREHVESVAAALEAALTGGQP